MATGLTCGFYELYNVNVYYVTPSGRAWIVASCDDLGPDPREIDPADIPDGVVPVDDLLTPEEAIGHVERIQEVSGEHLLEGHDD